jgi:hypothetical protein
VRRRHASHITVVLSKAAHSGPSVCLRARAPCPLRVSCSGTDRAERAAQAAGVSVQCKLQVLALPCLPWVKTLLKSDEKEGSQAVVTVTAFNGAGLNTSSLITFIFDNQLPVFVGKTILDCCTVHPCHDGDMNFTSNDGLLKGCWMKHHFVQNISGISNFESRLDKYRMDTTRSQNPHPMCLISSPGAIWAEILPAGQSV